MGANNGNGEDTVGSSPSVAAKGFFDAGIQAIANIADVADKSGLKNTSLAAGIVIILALIAEFLSTGDYVPNHGEIIGLIMGSLFIIIPVVLEGLGYKWQLHAAIRKQELVTENLRIEADYQLGRLEFTGLGRNANAGRNEDIPEPPR